MLLVEIHNGTDTLENSLAIFITFNIYFPYDPAVQPLGIYPREMKLTFSQKPVHEHLATLFVVTQIWKQPKYPTLSE